MLELLTKHRRNLHKIPEIGYDLPKTEAYVLRAVAGLSAEIEHMAEHGLTLFFDAGKPDTLAFRTDMDALAMQELNDTDYASTHQGCMHACGHDAHMAMMLAFAAHVDGRLSELNHNVLLIFQPAEESGGGAVKICESGILERKKVRAIYALHVDPHLQIGEVGSRPGPFMARASEVWAHVTGKSTHIARAAEGVDALWAGAEFYRRAVEMEKGYQSVDPKVLKFGLFRSGTAQNIIADHARIGGTMRTYAVADYEFMKRRLFEIAQAIEAETGARIELEVQQGYPAILNDQALFDGAKALLAGIPFVTFESPSLLGEDFSCYMQRIPGLMLYVGVGDVPPLHSPAFDFDERALLTGVEVLKRLCHQA